MEGVAYAFVQECVPAGDFGHLPPNVAPGFAGAEILFPHFVQTHVGVAAMLFPPFLMICTV